MSDITYFAIGLIIGVIILILVWTSRSKMYIPEHWHAFIPFSILLIVLYIEQKIKEFSSAVLMMEIGVLVSWIAIEVKAAMYQAYVTGWGSGRKEIEPEQEKPAGELIDWNTGRVIERRPLEPTFSQTVDMPKVDTQRRVARTLIDQRNHNMKVDLTESFWIERGNFGESRDKFVAMKDRWRKKGVIRKAGDRKNAPDEVADWRLVRNIADGSPLPH